MVCEGLMTHVNVTLRRNLDKCFEYCELESNPCFLMQIADNRRDQSTMDIAEVEVSLGRFSSRAINVALGTRNKGVEMDQRAELVKTPEGTRTFLCGKFVLRQNDFICTT